MSKESRNLLIFFIATFIWTWAFYVPIAISGNSPYTMPWMVLLIIGGAGPSIVGVTMVLLTYDKQQRGDYWRRCFSLKRITPLWWAVIFLMFPIVVTVSVAIDRALGGSMPGMQQLQDLVANPAAIPLTVLISFMSGPWSEEFGWRGYALDPMLKRFGTIAGSVVLGLIWGIWHLPLYFMPATWHGKMGFQLAGFWTFIGVNIALALIMTWVYKYTKRSILAAMLLHFGANFTMQLIAPSSDQVEIIRVILLLGIGLTACVLLNRSPKSPGLRVIESTQSA
ncbi:MAG: CPBP family intramembrane metalloprotease [Anaerolineae bacterium]|nr:CPBP family intramembrane metalloprotease [Anaerolineae bacterium]